MNWLPVVASPPGRRRRIADVACRGRNVFFTRSESAFVGGIVYDDGRPTKSLYEDVVSVRMYHLVPTGDL